MEATLLSEYWIADFCSERAIPFTLGNALYMKAMLRGGMFPVAHVYPKEMRATRDLLRRREYFIRHQAELYTHLVILYEIQDIHSLV